jgi:transcriptional regulator with XRE-family HTH domain
VLSPGVPPGDLLEDGEEARRASLAGFLKRKRGALDPVALGLPVSARRRSGGLLREEVAQRAGTSLTWYTHLEQARDIRISPELVERLATALQLTEPEREHLRRLARPQRSLGALTDKAPEALQGWLQGLAEPAYALNGVWDVLAWSPSATTLLDDFAAVPPAERNLLRLLFLTPGWRRRLVDWEEIVAYATEQFRADAALRPGCSRIRRLIADLRTHSRFFDRVWTAGALAAPAPYVKRLRNDRGEVSSWMFVVLSPAGVPPDVRVSLYSEALGPARISR